MDINIQIRFAIGNKVWVPGNYYEWYPIKKEYEVIGIKIQINSENKKIFYTLKDEFGDICEYPERLCFSSYDECEQWCIKDNRL